VTRRTPRKRRRDRSAVSDAAERERVATAIYDAAHALPPLCATCGAAVTFGTDAKVCVRIAHPPIGAPLLSVELACRACYGAQASN
jgi:hypothetical protein